MARPGDQKHMFNNGFLLVMLAISIVTNCILVMKLRYPAMIQEIRYAFISAPKVQPGDRLLGKADAKNTVIEYADLQCPYCATFHEAMRSVMKSTDDTRWVFRHFPLPGHPLAAKAAEAVECAGEQARFWEYSDAVFNLKSELTEPAFSKMAAGLRLDVTAFDRCLGSGKYRAVVAGQHADGLKLKIEGTPTLFINGKRYAGSMSAENILKVLGVTPPVEQHIAVPSESKQPVDNHAASPARKGPVKPESADACSEEKQPSNRDSQAQSCK